MEQICTCNSCHQPKQLDKALVEEMKALVKKSMSECELPIKTKDQLETLGMEPIDTTQPLI